ncbi:hypothetical protein CC2G_003048 [Coprinopsis cinerea AmutBmut pab1-1]|nr:hypothetical protein CC2G_003048 [Coprinopsis cinerea AmutBmut pab1-1]
MPPSMQRPPESFPQASTAYQLHALGSIPRLLRDRADKASPCSIVQRDEGSHPQPMIKVTAGARGVILHEANWSNVKITPSGTALGGPFPGIPEDVIELLFEE